MNGALCSSPEATSQSATQTTFDGGYVRNKSALHQLARPAGPHQLKQTIQLAFSDVSDPSSGEKYHGVRTQQEPAKDLRESVDVLLMRSYFRCCPNIYHLGTFRFQR